MSYEDSCSAESSCVRYQQLEKRKKRKQNLDAAEEAKWLCEEVKVKILFAQIGLENTALTL